MTSFARFALVLAAPLFLTRCSSTTADLEPINWQKVPGGGPRGSVLGFGSPGAFDEKANFTISAFKDGALYKLYYGGADTSGDCPTAGINSSHWRIGLAQSSDGLNWTRVPGDGAQGEILGNGAAGSFDNYLTYRPFVLKDGSIYRMWYNGSTKPFNCPKGTLADNRRIGYCRIN